MPDSVPRCPRLGGERQGQGRDRAGPRVPRHRQPHSPRDARVLGPETNAAGKGGGDVISTHTNSRSLEVEIGRASCRERV